MKRDFNGKGNPAERIYGKEFEGYSLDSALEKAGGRLAAGGDEGLTYEPAVELSRRGEAEPAGGYMMGSPQRLHMDSLRGRLHAAEGVLVRPRSEEEEENSAAAAEERGRPEVEGMLEKVLEAGDGDVIERLKEMDAEIAEAACTGAEVGELIGAYYVPLLLSALALSDEAFEAEYPGEGRVTSEERGELIDAILGHVQDCPRCELKYLSDMEWDAYLEKVRKPKPRPRMRIFA